MTTLLQNHCINRKLRSRMHLCFVEDCKELTEEEKDQIVHSEEFLIFFDRSIRMVERTLAEDLDIFTDYSGRDMQDRERSGRFSLKQCFDKCSLNMRHTVFTVSRIFSSTC